MIKIACGRRVINVAVPVNFDLLELNSKLKGGTAGLSRVGKAEDVPTKLLTDYLADIEANSYAFWIQVSIGLESDKRLE